MDPLKRIAEAAGRLELAGVPQGYDALVLGDLAKKLKGKPVLFVARDEPHLNAFFDALAFFAPEVERVRFPAWDCLPYDRMGPTPAVSAQRMAALFRLQARGAAKTPLIVGTTAYGAMQRVPPRDVVAKAGFAAKAGQDLDLPALEGYFGANGYAKASTVTERGEYAVRGGVIDAYPPGGEEPVRLDLFGDTLEAIRAFDPLSQRSTKPLTEVEFLPVSEVLIDEGAISRFRSGYLKAFGAAGEDPLYATVSEGGRRQGMEHFLPLFYDRLETLFDYIGEGAMIALDHHVDRALNDRWAMVEDYHASRAEAAKAKTASYRPLPTDALYLTRHDWDTALEAGVTRQLSPFRNEGEGVVDLGANLGRDFAPERAQDSTNLFEAAVAHAKALAKGGKRTLFASWSEGSSSRLASMLGDHGLKKLPLVADWAQAKASDPKTPMRVVLPLEGGFETESLAVISETDILGDRLARPRKKKRATNFLTEASSLSAGDLVVHVDHGIGRYDGLKTLEVQEAPHDCLELIYFGDSKLYLPVENIDLLTRYGAESEGVQLDRLGGAAWQNRKARAKERLREMAEGLIKIAALRQARSTEEIDPPGGAFDEFCARFPYEETDDQLSAVEDILTDLHAGKPMDRLICGDVGFGKTEVAVRAAFVVAMTGKQVAIVAPTTLLARQHLKTFRERFAGWPLKVAGLSRLTAPKEAAETRKGIASGDIDIIVGTHAVLSDQVKFRDLGMVVVDEEQHFGVKHKEKLKALREGVHVLTLSATPIPRTLQMALSGIREMSIIATPPVDRLAVRTYVTPFDPVTVREALLREKYRGGQAYYVAPRVKDLPDLQKFLKDQVPEVKFAVGHGQMAASELEGVMGDFYEGKYDVLLSTTIVESGLDVPTANTLIVHRADMFGLSQLYQLRGRVGRSKTRAYAYLTTPDNREITEGADKRLRVLQSLDSLGAGFQLASHDLDIRGGGNLLGDEQSGHIKEIGVELYQQMLEDAVAELKAGGQGEADLAEARGWSPQINTGAAVLIPDAYIPDLNVRLAMYRRLSEAEKPEDREALAAELIDRFGPLPEEAQALMKVVGVKGACRQAGVSKLDVGPKGAVVHFLGDRFANPAGLVGLIQKRGEAWKLRPDNRVVVKGDFSTPEQRLKAAESISGELAKIARAA